MRSQTLKSYTTSNLEKYLNTYKNKQKRLSTLLKLSKKDSRVAQLSQAYFFANNKIEQGNLFFEYTGEQYNTYSDFLDSDSKFVYLFNKKRDARIRRKKSLRIKILKKKEENNYSYYKMTQLLNSSQSNISLFFKKEEYDKMSTSQLERLNKMMSKD